MKFIHYYGLSILATLSTIIYAAYTREQFYPIVLFLVTSKVSFVVNTNFIISNTILMGKLMVSLFLSSLRTVEIEMLIEQSKFAAIEICIALTMFRNDGLLNPTFLGWLWMLLLAKAFHWLANSRLDYLDQVLPTSSWAQVRLGALIFVLILIDGIGAYATINYSLADNAKSVFLLFSFEFGLLSITVLHLLTRFVLHVIDIHLDNGLLSKGLYLMVADLICDAFRFITYVFFVSLVMMSYGLPIHILREVYISFATFQQHLSSFIRYLKLSRNLDQRFENATPEELTAAGDCLICRESMSAGKKLACQHVFHLDCLRMWLQHKQSCPLCRAEIAVDEPVLSAAVREQLRIAAEAEQAAAAVAAAAQDVLNANPALQDANGREAPAVANVPDRAGRPAENQRIQVAGHVGSSERVPIRTPTSGGGSPATDPAQGRPVAAPSGPPPAQEPMMTAKASSVLRGAGMTLDRSMAFAPNREIIDLSENVSAVAAATSSVANSSSAAQSPQTRRAGEITVSSESKGAITTPERVGFNPGDLPYHVRLEDFPLFMIVTNVNSTGALFNCTTSRTATVRSSPSETANIVRTIRSGTIVFVTRSTSPLSGMVWLCVVDGWVLQNETFVVPAEETRSSVVGFIPEGPTAITVALCPLADAGSAVKEFLRNEKLKLAKKLEPLVASPAQDFLVARGRTLYPPVNNAVDQSRSGSSSNTDGRERQAATANADAPAAEEWSGPRPPMVSGKFTSLEDSTTAYNLSRIMSQKMGTPSLPREITARSASKVPARLSRWDRKRLEVVASLEAQVSLLAKTSDLLHRSLEDCRRQLKQLYEDDVLSSISATAKHDPAIKELYVESSKSEVLPEGWYCEFDPASQHYYYVNAMTNESQWEIPDKPAAAVEKRGGEADLTGEADSSVKAGVIDPNFVEISDADPNIVQIGEAAVDLDSAEPQPSSISNHENTLGQLLHEPSGETTTYEMDQVPAT